MAERCWPEDAGCLESAAAAEQHKAVPAPFLTKTYQLVDDPSTNHIVSWGDDRVSTFVVWRPPEFARDLLPNYFKHNNFSSFVRQLNTYGFRKVVPERWEFANEFFRKGEKHLLCEIHRRKTSASAAASSPPSPPPLPFLPFYHFDEPPPQRLLVLGGAGVGAEALLEENEGLRRSNAALVSELAHMRKLYNDIIYFVQNHIRPVAPSSAASPLLLSSYQRKATAAGSATSSSSLTIAEEPYPFENGESSTMSTSNPKLFGVTLGGSSSKRGLHLRTDEPSSTKPRLFLSKDDLGFNPMPPASPSSST